MMSEKGFFSKNKAKKIIIILLILFIPLMIYISYLRNTNTGADLYWCLGPILYIFVILFLILRFANYYNWFGDKEEE